jgi:hypothetical protein
VLAVTAATTGLAAAKSFAAPGGESAALRPTQVVHKNTRLIAVYGAAAYGGAVCAIIATVLLGWLVRRSRRDRRLQREQREKRQWQGSAWARPASPQPLPGNYPPPGSYRPPLPNPPPPPVRNRDYPNGWFDPRLGLYSSRHPRGWRRHRGRPKTSGEAGLAPL